MADFRMFVVPTGLVKDEALAKVVEMLKDVPEAQQSFEEHYGGAHLAVHGSPATLVDVARRDRQVKDVHGTAILASGLALVVSDLVRTVAAQQQEIEELKAAKPTKAATAKGSTKR
jgi:uncharacterized small protein (DUF1192 family)